MFVTAVKISLCSFSKIKVSPSQISVKAIQRFIRESVTDKVTVPSHEILLNISGRGTEEKS